MYRARDPRLGRDVAIKILPADFNADPDRLRRFEQEAHAAAALNHPNILAVYDIGTSNGAPYIVSELLHGETLRTSCSAPGGLTLRKALDYAVQIARGLAAAHEKGIVHRDLKPENLLVTRDGQVKILDFGLAKLVEVAPALAGVSELRTTSPDTQPGMLLGTVGYMAPEQLRGHSVDYRADIFAFGAILYEMLADRRAFAGVSAADTIGAVLDKHPPELPLAERHIPPGLARLVDRCLEKSPAARFQSTRDLIFALEALDTPSSTSTPPALPRARRGREHLGWIVAAALLVALVAMAMLFVRGGAPAATVSRFEINTPPSDDPVPFALSPDGRQLAFLATSDGRSRLWVRSFDSTTARPIAGTDGASHPFWAPDGRAVGFFADGKLKRMDLASGLPQVLADAPIGRGGTWNRDGIIVFSPTTVGGLMRIAESGGTATAVTQAGGGGQVSHRFPHFLPDGRRFLFHVTQGLFDTRGVYVGSLDGGEPARVLAADAAPAYAAPGFLLLVSRGVLMAYPFDSTRGSVTGEPLPLAQSVGIDVAGRGAFSVSDAGTLVYRTGGTTRRQLIWVDRAGKQLGVLGSPDEWSLAAPELAPDGQAVALYRNPEQSVDVWVMDVARGNASRVTSDAALDSGPVWSSDGSRLIFRSTRNGKYDLFEKPANGASDEQPVLVSGQDKAPLDASPDGRFLLYTSQDPMQGSDLWALPLVGDRKPFPVVQTGFDEVHGQFSPDGRWLAYSSNESGRYEVYIRPFPGPGGRSTVSTAGGIYPRWSRDGRELFYVTLDNRVMAAPIQSTPGATALTPGAPVALFSTRMALNGNVGTGGFASKAQYDVAADGRFLLNVTAEDTPTLPIIVTLNWAAALND